MNQPSNTADRRQYRRVPADIWVRPVSLFARAVPTRVNDASVGGLRSYADEPGKPGQRLELELSFDGGDTVTVLAEVVWSQRLPEGSPARYDVGLRYIDASAEGIARIRRAIEEAPAGGEEPTAGS